MKYRNQTNITQHLCFFGLGVQFHDCYHQLVLTLGREPDFLCDNDPSKWGKEFFGKICITPSELRDLGVGTTVTITVRKYEPLHLQLRELGLQNIFVACFDRGYDVVHNVKRFGVEPDFSLAKSAVTSVHGKWTLVTGASRGVGRQIAHEMARLGSNIVAHSRLISHTEGLVAACKELGVQVVAVAADLAIIPELERMLDELEHVVPQIDFVFNNAAISLPCGSDPWCMSATNYLNHYIVNAVAPILICNRLLPPMIRRGFGRIVNVSSTIQKRPLEMAYACSKAALSKYVHDFAPSLQGTGVMMSLLCPGFVRSDMGGSGAPHPVENVLPGALLGALMDGDINGRWFIAQDYAGMDLKTAVHRAEFYYC